MAKGGDYDNFVTVNGNPIEGTAELTFGAITVCERGDANADGSVTPADMIAVKNAFYGGAPLNCETAADCNCDLTVTPADMICIKNAFYGS